MTVGYRVAADRRYPPSWTDDRFQREGRVRPRAVTAPVRRSVAADLNLIRYRDSAIEHWQHAAEIRREWLTHGLCTEPADRTAAEHSLAAIYARVSRRRPRFVWVGSPRQALPLLTGRPTHDVLHSWVVGRQPPGSPPLASDLATRLHRLRSALDESLTDPDLDPPPTPRVKPARGQKPARDDPKALQTLRPEDALHDGVPLRNVLRHGVWEALRASLADGFYLPVRAALGATGSVPVGWYGQQDASWIAFYDTVRRLGLGRFPAEDAEHLDDWAVLARSCGWWWPGEQTCVVVERPAVIDTEPVPGGWYEQRRLRQGNRFPVVYRDGWRPPVGRPTVAVPADGSQRKPAPPVRRLDDTQAEIMGVRR
jgi:hypothetical protein